MVVPDAFGIVDHQLCTLINVIREMSVFPERMRENLKSSYSTFASQKLEMFLKRQGMYAEIVYRTVQAACDRAVNEKKDLSLVITDDWIVSELVLADLGGFADYFNLNIWIEEEEIYRRAEVKF